MLALTRVAALEMARYGVTVNCVAPFAHTRMTESIKGVTPEQQTYLERRTRATVEQILPLLTFLISDDAAEISGQVFGVRGHEVFSVFAAAASSHDRQERRLDGRIAEAGL